jgi:aspartate racemase
MMAQNTIGILAGMGPRSTAPFIDLIVSQCELQYGAKLDEEFPHMMIYSLPTPFYIDAPIDHEKMKKVVKLGLKRLEETGVNFIAIPCNTVHAYFDELAASVGVKILNIIEESMREIQRGKGKKIALIATRPTVESRVYHQYIERGSADFIHSEFIQERVDALIADVKTGKAPEQLYSEWATLINQVCNAGADSAIIACTDLSKFQDIECNIEITDSSLALAKAVVSEYLRL